MLAVTPYPTTKMLIVSIKNTFQVPEGSKSSDKHFPDINNTLDDGIKPTLTTILVICKTGCLI